MKDLLLAAPLRIRQGACSRTFSEGEGPLTGPGLKLWRGPDFDQKKGREGGVGAPSFSFPTLPCVRLRLHAGVLPSERVQRFSLFRRKKKGQRSLEQKSTGI